MTELVLNIPYVYQSECVLQTRFAEYSTQELVLAIPRVSASTVECVLIIPREAKKTYSAECVLIVPREEVLSGMVIDVTMPETPVYGGY